MRKLTVRSPLVKAEQTHAKSLLDETNQYISSGTILEKSAGAVLSDFSPNEM